MPPLAILDRTLLISLPVVHAVAVQLLMVLDPRIDSSTHQSYLQPQLAEATAAGAIERKHYAQAVTSLTLMRG